MSRKAMVYQPASRSKLLDLQSHDLDKWLNRLETEAVQLLQVLARHVMGSKHFPLSPITKKWQNEEFKPQNYSKITSQEFNFIFESHQSTL